jgi:hypothetical protein
VASNPFLALFSLVDDHVMILFMEVGFQQAFAPNA